MTGVSRRARNSRAAVSASLIKRLEWSKSTGCTRIRFAAGRRINSTSLEYHDELGKMASEGGVGVHYTFTREPPPDWTGFARRLDAEMLRTVGPSPMRHARIFACGPTAFVEQGADLLVNLGHEPAAIPTERFGPTG